MGDYIYMQQIGHNREAFFNAWADKVLPELR